MMLRKSTELEIKGRVVGVKASISLGRPGTAAERSFEDPMVVRIACRSLG